MGAIEATIIGKIVKEMRAAGELKPREIKAKGQAGEELFQEIASKLVKLSDLVNYMADFHLVKSMLQGNLANSNELIGFISAFMAAVKDGQVNSIEIKIDKGVI